jgi:hypothetical protein
VSHPRRTRCSREKQRGDVAIIHRTVRWSTRLSGESSAANSSLSGKATGQRGYNSPDCPVSHPRRTRSSREKQRGNVAIIHRTVRWCTGLSGEPTVAIANGRPHNLRATHGLLQRSAGAPDCPVCTGQCPVRQSAQRSNGRIYPI